MLRTEFIFEIYISYTDQRQSKISSRRKVIVIHIQVRSKLGSFESCYVVQILNEIIL